MNVVIITPRYPPNIKGGGEISVHILAKELSKYTKVRVISFDKNVTSRMIVEGIEVMRFHPIVSRYFKVPVNSRALFVLKQMIYKKEDTIFHSYNHDLMPVLGFMTQKYNFPSVATLNGSVYFTNLDTQGRFRSKRNIMMPLVNLRNKAMLKFIKYIKLFTTLSQFYRDVVSEAGIPRDKIEIIPNMIDPNFKPLPPQQHGRVRILYLGSFIFSRGVDILIKAYSMLEKQDVELIIAGDNPDKILPLINSLKIKNKIRLIGKVPYEKVPEIYSSVDIYLQPYRYPYPIGRTILEAMKSRLPVITTGTDYYSPVIENNKSGILIYPMEPSTLAESLQRLIDSPKLRKKLSTNAYKRVTSTCSPQNIVKKYIQVYNQILDD